MRADGTKRLLLTASVGALAVVASPGFALAQTSAESANEKRIQALEQEVQALHAELASLHAADTRAIVSSPNPANPQAIAAAPQGAGNDPAARRAQRNDDGFARGTPTSAATASLIGGHPSIASTDGRFTANLLGVMQFDTALYDQSAPGPIATDLRRGAGAGDTGHARDLSSGTDFRRARLGIGGKMFGDFEYDLLYEFGGSGEEDAGHIQELWLQYSGFKPLHFRVGAFAPFIGLEDAGSTNGMLFLERPASADIARSLAGGDFREAAQVVANSDRWFVSGAVTGRTVGVVNSTASGVAQPYDSQLGFIGRAAFVPFKTTDYLLHLGVHGSVVAHPADTGGPDTSAGSVRYPIQLRERPELRVDGTRLIDTGAIDASGAHSLGAEAAFRWRNLFLQAEYDQISIERRNSGGVSGLTDPRFSGWYVEGSWLLTGEARKYNPGNFAFDGPTPSRSFSGKDGNWGALELAFRWSDTDLNYHQGAEGSAPAADAIRGGEQKIFSAGLNWYLNPAVRFMFDYQRVNVDRLSPNAVTFVTPLGAQIGQSYNAYAIRSQLAF